MPNPRTFFDVAHGDQRLGRIVFELFADSAPITAENFRALCTGSHGISSTNSRPLSYKSTLFHRIIPTFMIQCGATPGESIYGPTFADETFDLPIDKPGLLVMANKGPNTNSSQFFITLNEAPHLNGKHVVFGRVVNGMDIVNTIASLPTGPKDKPLIDVTVAHCGELEMRKVVRKQESTDSDSSSSSESDSEVEERRRRKKERKRARKEEKRERKRLKKEAKRATRKSEDGEDDEVKRFQLEEQKRLDEEEQQRLEEKKAVERKRREEELARLKADDERRRRRREEDGRSDGEVRFKGRGIMKYREGGSGGMRGW